MVLNADKPSSAPTTITNEEDDDVEVESWDFDDFQPRFASKTLNFFGIFWVLIKVVRYTCSDTIVVVCQFTQRPWLGLPLHEAILRCRKLLANVGLHVVFTLMMSAWRTSVN